MWAELLQSILSAVLGSAASAGIGALTARPSGGSGPGWAGPPPTPGVAGAGSPGRPSALNFTGGFTGTAPGLGVGSQGRPTETSAGFKSMDMNRLLGQQGSNAGFQGI